MAVVPQARNRTGQLGVAARRIIDVALVDADEIGEDIEVVGVVVAAIDVGLSGDFPSGGAPHLRHIDVKGGEIYALNGVPNQDFTPQSMDFGDHLRQKVGIGDALLVGADVKVGGMGENGGHFLENGVEGGDTLRRLHVETHGADEGFAVAGHVDLGDNGHTALTSVGFEGVGFGLRVVLSGETRHGGGGSQLRKGFDLKAPRLVFREVPMKDVDFEARQEVDLSAKVVDRDKRASDVVHKTADFEGGKVGDREAFEPWCGATLRELAQSLCGANHTDGRGGGDVDALGRNAEPIAF